MQPTAKYPLTVALLLGVCLFPLLASQLIGTNQAEGAQTPAIYLEFEPGKIGKPDTLVGHAPPNMELAVYLNDDLYDVITTSASGEFTLDMPVLPPRSNDITALPTQFDPSTLALLYDPYGFSSLYIGPADLQIEEPFLASATREAEGIRLYGSATPFTTLDIFAGTCSESNPKTRVTSKEISPDGSNNRIDSEGSFKALIPFPPQDAMPDRYCLRVAPEKDPSAVKEYQVEAPASGSVGSEAVWSRSIQVTFTPESVQFVFSVEMPDRTLVYQNMARGNMSETQFLRYVFGEVTLNAFVDPRKLAWRQEKDPGSDRVRVLIESEPLPFLIPEDTATTLELNTHPVNDSGAPPYSTTDTLTTTLDGVRVLETNPPATSGDTASQTWSGSLVTTPRFKLTVSRFPNPPADPIGRARLKESVAAVVTQLPVETPALLNETLEGQIIGVLPAGVPAAVQAQVYDYFGALYQGAPFIEAAPSQPTFQAYLRDFPSRIPGWIGDFIFGAVWLIPSLFTLLALRAKSTASTETVRADLTRVASGAIVLSMLALNWGDVFWKAGAAREAYLQWTVAAQLVFLILFFPLPRWTRWLFARPAILFLLSLLFAPIAAFAAKIFMITLPDGWASALMTALPLLGFASLAWTGFTVGQEKTGPPSVGFSIAALALIAGMSLPVQSLPLGTQLAGTIGVSTLGASLIRPLVPLAVLAGIIVSLRGAFNRPLGASLGALERGLGRVLLTSFAVGLTPAWGFVPVSLVGSLLFLEWLLPRKPIRPAGSSRDFMLHHHKEGIEQMLTLNRKSRLWRSFEASAQKQIRESKLDEATYHEKRGVHEQEKRAIEQPEYLAKENLTLREMAFNFGAGRDQWDNLKNALAWGVILAAPLVVLQGWGLASQEIQNAGSFPFASVVIRLFALIAQYIGAAALLGWFFPHMRGRNGLEKGGWLAGAVILSSLPYHLLYASNLTEWMVAAIWAASMLAFNLIISLLAFDVRTLLHYNLGVSRLPDLYDFGELAAYLTGSGAPLVTTLVTAVSNQLDQWVPALLRVVFPSYVMTEAQFQLLQMLIDLAHRIATAL